MAQDIDSQLASAAVLAHGALNSLSLIRVAFGVLDESCDRSDWTDEMRALVDAVPEQIALTLEHLRMIVSSAETTAAVDTLDRLSMRRALSVVPAGELESRLGEIFERRLDRPLLPEEQQDYVYISEELRRRRA